MLSKERFWTTPTTEENNKSWNPLIKAGEKALGESFVARQPAYFSEEQEASCISLTKYHKGAAAIRNNKQHKAAKLALPYAEEWIRYLHEQGTRNWGFVCLYDAAAQMDE